MTAPQSCWHFLLKKTIHAWASIFIKIIILRLLINADIAGGDEGAIASDSTNTIRNESLKTFGAYQRSTSSIILSNNFLENSLSLRVFPLAPITKINLSNFAQSNICLHLESRQK